MTENEILNLIDEVTRQEELNYESEYDSGVIISGIRVHFDHPSPMLVEQN